MSNTDLAHLTVQQQHQPEQDGSAGKGPGQVISHSYSVVQHPGFHQLMSK